MAADPVHAKEATSSFLRSDYVFCNSDCQCYSVLKRDFQVFVNEIKSMTEIINHLEKEQKYDSATKQDRMLYSVCEEQLKTSSLQCCNCSNLENQLKDALNELGSVKLITEILNDEIKSLKPTSQIDSNVGNSCLIAKPSNSRGQTTVRPPKEVHTTHGIPVACRYAILSNCQEPQEPNDIFSSNSEQSSRIMPVNKHKYIKGLRRKKTLSVSQP
jgi:hypothetical protein